MNRSMKALSLTALSWAFSAAAFAQQPDAAPAATPAAPKPSAQSEAGEPRADTSNSATGAPAAETSAAPSSAPPADAARSRATPAAARAPAERGAAAAGSGQKPGSKVDRLDLGMATVTGDREQPKVMYIVPWKKSDIGDLAGKPMNSLVDEILAPVDRDVFKREVVYYHAVQADASQNGASPKPAQQGEK